MIKKSCHEKASSFLVNIYYIIYVQTFFFKSLFVDQFHISRFKYFIRRFIIWVGENLEKLLGNFQKSEIIYCKWHQTHKYIIVRYIIIYM